MREMHREVTIRSATGESPLRRLGLWHCQWNNFQFLKRHARHACVRSAADQPHIPRLVSVSPAVFGDKHAINPKFDLGAIGNHAQFVGCGALHC